MKAQETLDNNLNTSWFRNLYAKILKSCGHKRAPWLLGILSFTESCIFIIPPEVMLFPMSYANRNKAWRYAFITTITSVMGAIAGYYLGATLWQEIQPYVFDYIPGFEKNFDKVGEMYKDNAMGSLFLAAFTPIPFKVFTVAAGVWSTKISLTLLILTSLLGRGLRYYIMAGLVYFLGERAQVIIEKHFKLFTVAVAILGVAVIAFLKLRH